MWLRHLLPQENQQNTSRHLTVGIVQAVAIGLLCAWLTGEVRTRSDPTLTSDLSIVHAGARAYLAGRPPYQEVGPGRPFTWPFPLLYPFTAMTIALPLAPLPRAFADLVWAFFGSALLAWLAWARPTLYWIFPSFMMVAALVAVQWAPLFTAATLLPIFGFLWAAKPNIAVAYLVAFPSRVALSGMSAITLLSLFLVPTWPGDWLSLVRSSYEHLPPPILRWGGPLLLLAWVDWRRPEARLLGTLALIPHLPQAYETLPLFLIPRTHAEAAGLAVMSWGVFYGNLQGTDDTFTSMVFLFLPALALVLWHWRQPPGKRTW